MKFGEYHFVMTILVALILNFVFVVNSKLNEGWLEKVQAKVKEVVATKLVDIVKHHSYKWADEVGIRIIARMKGTDDAVMRQPLTSRKIKGLPKIQDTIIIDGLGIVVRGWTNGATTKKYQKFGLSLYILHYVISAEQIGGFVHTPTPENSNMEAILDSYEWKFGQEKNLPKPITRAKGVVHRNVVTENQGMQSVAALVANGYEGTVQFVGISKSSDKSTKALVFAIFCDKVLASSPTKSNVFVLVSSQDTTKSQGTPYKTLPAKSTDDLKHPDGLVWSPVLQPRSQRLATYSLSKLLSRSLAALRQPAAEESNSG